MNEALVERFVVASERIAAALEKMAKAEHRMMDMAHAQMQMMQRCQHEQMGDHGQAIYGFGDPENN